MTMRALLLALAFAASAATAQPACDKPVYLTLDTGHMGIANFVAEVLKRHDIKVTFFAANEKTQEGSGSLSRDWADWWRARGAEGHEFASHTWDHTYWVADVPGKPPRFRVRPSAGPDAGKESTWTAAEYCREIERAALRLEELTGKAPLPLFRAPGGKVSERFLAATRACGYRHVGWAPAGFLGDELPSESFSNQYLLQKALRDIRSGDILLAHLGIWSRKDPWAPAALEPLIKGLKAKGFCFATLREHPAYRSWIMGRK